MSAPAPAIVENQSVARLVHRAAQALAGATTAAQVLDARDKARAAYDDVKRHLRMQKAKRAHDDVIAAAKRAQADALEIEAAAQRRLADEYDAAQERGEVSRQGQHASHVPDGNMRATASEIGLSRKDIFEARQLRDAMAERPGIVREALDQLMAEGDEPTRSALKRAIAPLASRANLRAAVGTASASKEERGHNLYETPIEAMRTLLALERFGPRVREPSCGRGAILRPLEDAGYEVEIADLVDYGTATKDGECQGVEDFLASRAASSPAGAGPSSGAGERSPGGQSAARPSAGDGAGGTPDIVTNPPYGGVLNAYVAHALRVHRPRKMALLLNLNFLAGFDDPDRCFALDDCPPARVLVFTRRLPMMHRDGWDGPEASSRMNAAWFIWERDSGGGYAGAFQVRRVDWKDFEGAAALGPLGDGEAA